MLTCVLPLCHSNVTLTKDEIFHNLNCNQFKIINLNDKKYIQMLTKNIHVTSKIWRSSQEARSDYSCKKNIKAGHTPNGRSPRKD